MEMNSTYGDAAELQDMGSGLYLGDEMIMHVPVTL